MTSDPQFYTDRKDIWQPWTHFERTAVTITPPGQSPVQINTTDADLVPTVPTAVKECRIAWSCATGRDHQEPGTAQLTLITDQRRPDWMHWDAAVTVTAHTSTGYRPGARDPDDLYSWFGSGGELLLFRGWVESVTTRRRDTEPPTWEHVLDCTDGIGRAASTMVGDTPWPTEFMQYRWPRIIKLTPWDGVMPWGALDPGRVVAAVDVDNRSLLDLMQETADSGFGRVVIGWDGRIDVTPVLPGNQLAWFWNGPADTRAVAAPILNIDASELYETPTITSRDQRITRVTIAYVTEDDGELTDRRITLDRRVPGASSVVSLTGRAVVRPEFAPKETTLSGEIAWARSLLSAEIEPRFSEPVGLALSTIYLDDGEDRAVLYYLCSLETRGRQLVRITNAPQGIAEIQRVIGVSLTIASDPRDQSLDLTLEPASATGQRALRIDDFRYIQRAPWLTDGSTDPITFDDTNHKRWPWWTRDPTIDTTTAHTPPPGAPQ